MKVALVARVEVPPLPSDDDLARAADRLRRLAETSSPLAVAVPGRVWRYLADHDLSVPTGDVQWLRMGWSEADLTVLPEPARTLQLTREADALSAMGIDPTGFFATTWDPTLVPTPPDHGIDHVVVPADTAGYGAADRFDRVLPVSEHPPDRRLRPPVDSPAFRSEPTDPSSEILYRKMLRLLAGMGGRSPAAVVSHVLETQHHSTYPGPIDPLLRRDLHRSLLRARHLLDSRRRGDTWVEVERLDWDADGAEEVQIESAALSLVVDPDSGRVLYLDDKAGDWPVTAIPDDGEPGLILTRLIATDDEPQFVRLPTVEKVEERRAGAALVVAGPHGAGTLSVTVSVEGSALRLAYHLDQMTESRLGPELPLAFGAGTPRMRVDGGEWVDVTEPVAATGHRFRFADAERDVLVVMPVPGDCFGRPLEPFGVVVWAHWPTDGAGDYELTVDLAP